MTTRLAFPQRKNAEQAKGPDCTCGAGDTHPNKAKSATTEPKLRHGGVEPVQRGLEGLLVPGTEEWEWYHSACLWSIPGLAAFLESLPSRQAPQRFHEFPCEAQINHAVPLDLRVGYRLLGELQDCPYLLPHTLAVLAMAQDPREHDLQDLLRVVCTHPAKARAADQLLETLVFALAVPQDLGALPAAHLEALDDLYDHQTRAFSHAYHISMSHCEVKHSLQQVSNVGIPGLLAVHLFSAQSVITRNEGICLVTGLDLQLYLAWDWVSMPVVRFGQVDCGQSTEVRLSADDPA
eukprot:gene4085-742_t